VGRVNTEDKREDAIFKQALQIADPEKRAAYLGEACRGDLQLLQRVEAKLQAQSPDVQPGENPNPISPWAAKTVPEGTGATQSANRYFGDYELLDEIARGGMGVVYRARQLSLNRQVALKRILSGQLATPLEVKRFRMEAEAAANLDHPNIVPIYEVGEHEGQQYFSMRLIKGRSLAHQIACFKDPKAAARLIATVARAVPYAHQRGILHRDLKPSNILIDAEGNPHVTDFGLAKLVERGVDLTLSGGMIGTPGYMAPEQAMGKAKQVTTAADIFSLGVILYEALIGLPPFRAATPLATIQQVLETEPKRPNSINRRIDRDLETICLKCLEKAPQQRYASAEALADDLERWLQNEPISARSISTLERTVKWARRRPTAAALATFVLLSLGGFVLMTAVTRNRLRYERDATTAATQEVELQRELAETNFAKASQAVEIYLAKVTDNPRLRESGFLALRKELLEAAIPSYEEFVRQRSDDAELLAKQGEALTKLGKIYGVLGDMPKEEESLRRAVEIQEKLAADFPKVPSITLLSIY
jgi:serine/threonine protein kinase